MPVTATGPISLPLDNGAALLSQSAAFRTWVGAANVAAAKAKAYLVDLDVPPTNGREYHANELTALRPYATVDEFEFMDGRGGGEAFFSRRAGQGVFANGGKLLVRFFGNANVAATARDNKVQFLNDVGGILSELEDLGGGDTDYLSVHEIVRWEAYRRASEDEVKSMGDFQIISYVLTWGP